ncbi:MAG TPA: dihydrolipoyllysine-residue acetyltransferase [Candidatus Binatia bacterium]|nr:dihydrolipoyllysine-residue acetyltransferase [Candidatus Binatia bacterium]
MSRTDVKVPAIGDYKDVPVIEVLVKDGDRVEKDAALITLESEKATMEVPAPEAGVVRGIRVKTGDRVSEGTVILALETAGAEGAARAEGSGKRPAPDTSAPAAGAPGPGGQPKPDIGPKEEQRPPPAPTHARPADPAPASSAPEPGVPPWTVQAGKDIPHASPMVRRVAREFGVELTQVKGSGPKGRIIEDDVKGFVKQSLGSGRRDAGSGIPSIPPQDFSLYGPVESKPLARIRKISAQHLHRAWLNVPHVTQHDEADITELEAFRKAQSEETGTKLTLLPFILKAVSVALKQFPEFNSSLAPDGESLVMKQYCHLGFAADTPNGLVVPVVRDVWGKGIVQLANECGELAKKARDGKLKADEMKGGCFSVSSLGGIGGGFFTPIVNAPEVAILGVSRAQMKPVWDGKTFAPRLLCPLSLSYDHRVIDGAYAARFIVVLGKLLADLRRVAL